MGKRQVAIVGVVGLGGLVWWLNRLQGDGGGVYAPVDLDYAGPDLDPVSAGAPVAGGVSDSYLASLSRAEDPAQDPFAKNPYSSASGLFQFTKGTWTSLGGDWGDDPSQAFGGLTPSADEQYAMAQKLTAGNSSILDKIGVGISNATLYATHILGAGTASKVLPGIMSADPSTPLTAFLPASTVAINPALGSTVASFLSYLTKKVGS